MQPISFRPNEQTMRTLEETQKWFKEEIGWEMSKSTIITIAIERAFSTEITKEEIEHQARKHIERIEKNEQDKRKCPQN